MSLGDRIRGWLQPAAEGARRRPRSQARPLSADVYEPQPFRRAHWVGLGAAALAAIVLTGSLVFIILNLTRPGESRGSATPTPALAVAASPSPAGLAEIFATPTATTPPAATAQTFSERAQIANTGGEGANLRREPSTTAERLRLLPEGALVEVVGPDRDAEGRRWRNVRDSDGESGWVPISFLAAEGSVSPTRPSAVAPVSTRPPAAAQAAPTTGADPPRATPTRPAAPAATKPAAARAQIANTSGQGANIRSEPGPGGRVLKTLAEGSPVEIIGPERDVEGRPWRQVRDSAGVTGWIVAGALVGAGTLPTPVPPAARTATPSSAGTAPANPTVAATARPTTPQPPLIAPTLIPGGSPPTPTPGR